MIRKHLSYFSLLIIVALFASCSSTKRVGKSMTVGNLSQKEYVDKVIDNSNVIDGISAKAVYTIKIGDKAPLSVSGSMKIKKGNGILLSVSPLLGIEVARMEITPSGVLILDRMKKRYVKVSFDEMGTYLKNNLDYNMLEALFMNSVFIPGKKVVGLSDSDDFILSKDGDNMKLHVKGDKYLDYGFITSINEGRLMESDISVKNSAYRMDWKYNDFKPFVKGEFPSSMNVNVDGIKKKIEFVMELSRMSDNMNMQLTGDAPQKYQKIGIDDILKMLSK